MLPLLLEEVLYKPPPTIVNTDSPVLTTNSTTYTFTAALLGTPHPTRIIAVVVGGIDSAITFTTTAVTIGGVTAEKQVEKNVVGGPPDVVTAIWTALVPHGTSADILVTFSEPITGCGIGVFAMYYVASAAAKNTRTNSSGSSPTTNPIMICGRGVVIGGACANGASTPTFTWDVLTEAYDEVVESPASHSAATAVFTTGANADNENATQITTTCTTAAGSAFAVVLAVFR